MNERLRPPGPLGPCLRIGCGGLLMWVVVVTDQGTGWDATCNLCARVAKSVMYGALEGSIRSGRFMELPCPGCRAPVRMKLGPARAALMDVVPLCALCKWASRAKVS